MQADSVLSVATLFAEREARLHRDRMLAENLVRRHKEELEEYRNALIPSN